MTIKLHRADEKAIRVRAKKRGIKPEDAAHEFVAGALNRWGALHKYQAKKRAGRKSRKSKKGKKGGLKAA